jgi:hypothetical protein
VHPLDDVFLANHFIDLPFNPHSLTQRLVPLAPAPPAEPLQR